MRSYSFPRIAVGTTLLALLAGPLSPAAAYTDAEAVCRYKVANSARTYLNHLAQRINTCHQRRMRNLLPAGLDCNAPSTWAANGYASGAEKMQTTIAKITDLPALCSQTGGTPADLGYTACPAPCAGMPMGTFGEVADCLRCVIDSCMLPAAEQIYGTVPLPVAYHARQCQQVMGIKLEEYTTKRLFLENICRYNQERGKPMTQGLNCITALDTPETAISVSHRRAMNDFTARIHNRCALVPDIVAELDSCAMDANSAVSCVFAATSACADMIYQAAMP